MEIVPDCDNYDNQSQHGQVRIWICKVYCPSQPLIQLSAAKTHHR